MIAQTNPLITTAAVTFAILGASFAGMPRKAIDPAPISGVLYSVSADTQAARTPAASLPQIDVGLNPAARVAQRVASTRKRKKPTIAARRRSQSRTMTTALSEPTHVIAIAPVTVSAPASAPATVPPPPPKPIFPPTFAEIDDALRASSTAQTVDFRIKKGGVSFRLMQIGRVGDRYVIRYAIANEEPSPFFLSIVNVAAGGKPILSETAGAYSCPTGQEVYGVVHFSPAAAAGKNVVVELVQSGGEHRRFSLAVDYAF